MLLILSGKSSLRYLLHGAYCIPKRLYTTFNRDWQVNLAGIEKNTFLGMLRPGRIIAAQYGLTGILSHLHNYYLCMYARFLSFAVDALIQLFEHALKLIFVDACLRGYFIGSDYFRSNEDYQLSVGFNGFVMPEQRTD